MRPLMAWVDGDVMPSDHATIPVSDEGLLRGDGCFEAVRVRAGVPFALADHLERLSRSGKVLRLDVARAAEAFAALCPDFDGVVRVLVTRGPPSRVIGLQQTIVARPPALRLQTIAAPWLPALGASTLAGAKTLSYAHAMAARRDAVANGFDDALLVNDRAEVLDGPTYSLLWVEGASVYGPALALGVLDSITRRYVEHREAPSPLERVLAASECMIVSTTAPGIGVSAIDDQTWSPSPGPVTDRITKELKALGA